jgi:membrane-bound metal-dependent hydrolase YbcI (DUF457 family)
MPITPYHFGPSGFVGLAFRRWIDLPVFVLANVIVDIEVLFAEGWAHHRHWHWHTLLVGAMVGAIWAIAAYPLRNLFKKMMQLLRIPYRTGFWKMVVSGVLGVWLHVVIDAVYHYDVQVFWPSKRNPMYGLLERQTVLLLCIISFLPAIALYVIAIRSQRRKK